MAASELLKLDEPELEGRFSAGTAAFTDARFNDFKAELPSLEKELTRSM